ncbi:MAG: hypothetical protein NVS1B7_1290 [Candidatus Saccharimonadales bacterium]
MINDTAAAMAMIKLSSANIDIFVFCDYYSYFTSLKTKKLKIIKDNRGDYGEPQLIGLSKAQSILRVKHK